MYFKDTLGNETVKALLLKECLNNHMPHAQLFSGPSGSGKLAMALAFCSYLFCANRLNDDACKKCSNCIKMKNLSHPDLHLFYPTIKIETKEKGSASKKNFRKIQEELIQNKYLSLNEWNLKIKGNNKTSSIRISDTSVIQKIYNLKSYEGFYKVFILWGAEKMNREAGSSLLKILEEPNPKTIFILISNDSNKLLKTIYSRLQIKIFHKISTNVMLDDLKNKHPEIDEDLILEKIIQNNNDYGRTLYQIKNNKEDEKYLQFIDWVRLCFLSINKKSHIKIQTEQEPKLVIESLINWCNNIASIDRESQIEFILAACNIFRETFLLNYNYTNLSYSNKPEYNFSLKNFSNYVHNNNIFDIFHLLNNAHYCLNRYANSKILFLDLSFSLGRVLHKID